MELKKRTAKRDDTWVEVFEENEAATLRLFTGINGPDDKRILVINNKDQKFWIDDLQVFLRAVDTLIKEVHD